MKALTEQGHLKLHGSGPVVHGMGSIDVPVWRPNHPHTISLQCISA